MLTFNAILRHEGIDPKTVRLVRHQDNKATVTPYNLWRAGDAGFEFYQRLQGREVFDVGCLIASFVATPADETLFVGLFSVDGIGVAPPGTIDPVSKTDCSGLHLYNIARKPQLAEYAGHVVIDWGRGYRSWVQLADRQDKPVLEIRRELRERPFPGFTQFRWDIDQINAVPLEWQGILKSVKGVYLLVCKDTGQQYVGSAKGAENLWQRFVEYAKTQHGGNVGLKRRTTSGYQVSVLEVVNSDFGIEQVEEAWKQKLLSRQFGLNRN